MVPLWSNCLSKLRRSSVTDSQVRLLFTLLATVFLLSSNFNPLCSRLLCGFPFHLTLLHLFSLLYLHFPFFLSVCGWDCTNTCAGVGGMYAYVCVHGCMLCLEARVWQQVFSFVAHHLRFWDRVCHWTWSSLFEQDWLSIRTPGSASLYPPALMLQYIPPHPGLSFLVASLLIASHSYSLDLTHPFYLLMTSVAVQPLLLVYFPCLMASDYCQSKRQNALRDGHWSRKA